MNISIKINRKVKTFDRGGVPHGIRFKARLNFTDLTIDDRHKLWIRTEKPNPNFESHLPESGLNPKMIPMTNEDTTETVTITEAVPYTANKTKLKVLIKSRMQGYKKQYTNRWDKASDVEVTLSADDDFE